MTEFHPVQRTSKRLRPNDPGQLRTEVTLRAYEVYAYVYSPQPAMITGPCRGGFSVGEIIAFLYAHSFPKSEWSMRVEEALEGMKL